MRYLPILRFAVLPLAVLSTFGSGARGDDAYVCDGGRLFYVKPATLEKFQAANLDPCTGRPFDATKPHAIGMPARTNPPAPRPSAEPMTPGLIKPPVGPALVPPPLRSAERPKSEVRPTSPARAETSGRPVPVTATSVTQAQPSRGPSSQAPSSQAAAEAHFRTVPILNAAPGGQAVYRHTR